ncbi:acyl-CoA dehydrogenase [Dietzia sp. PP-33]|jgi:alkylation response protein AidB-like acyl-CoA dehydrogenase|uniref:acyl-CoA dehydrogenase n=1 Tax=Dietzia sp. PP-33 TaxID=2957500 RepID=UPI0029AFCE4F|nr:acyl-CoA dehydrogenase [Dietzia sp. PP-33]MDX2356421.1 acyl-CoA dehydrogenase [Dietzia sp. PP-33]
MTASRPLPSTVLSRADIDFLLHDWLAVSELCSRERYADHSRETIDAVVDLSAELAEKYFAPHNRKADLNEPTLVGEEVELVPEIGEALRRFADADLVGAAMDERVGGMQLPYTAYLACMAWFYAANVSTAAYPLLTSANANLLIEHGSDEQIERYVKPMVEGRFTGTMCLSEPQAGSNLADITTRAEPQPDGTHRLFGQKMWISGGEHQMAENIVHLVLAKVPGSPAGTRGISLFVVPKFLVEEDGKLGERNDIVITGLNHKMGFRGTVNTMPTLGQGMHTPGGRPGAVGYLVGEENTGLKKMFTMMNEARLGVGLGATALGYTGYLKSLDYARNRPQGRPVGTDPSSPQVMLTGHADVRRMLLAQKSYVEGALALGLYCARLVDDEKTGSPEESAAATTLLDVLTPIAKSWPSQWCLKANELAVQVLGGAGYTIDYDVEQHYRDNRLNPIHEGTHGIQAQDLLGRKVLARGGAGLAALSETVAATCDRAEAAGGPAESFAALLRPRVARLIEVTTALAGVGASDPEAFLADATEYLEAAGHIVIAWIWLEQVLALGGRADDDSDAFAAGKLRAATYFLQRELPVVDAKFDLLAAGDRTTLDMRDDWF